MKRYRSLAAMKPSPGGAMVHTGTLASKTLRESAMAISGVRSRGFGVHLGLGRMPHIGSRVVDDQAVKLVSDWIKQMPSQ